MKKGKLVIILIVIFVLLILLIGGVFAYITTDFLKSDETLFFKYIGQAIDDLKYVENKQISEIEELKNTMPYNLVGNLSYSAGEENSDINSNILERIKVGIDAKVNKGEKQAYAKTNIFYNNQDLFTLEYANSNNIYALRSNEIVTAFLGIENENLKILAQKLGIIDTVAIPDSINQIDINETLSLTDEEKAHISEIYLNVLVQNINVNNFSKESNVAVNKENVTYNTTGYRLNLNSEELKQIEIALLQALKEDSITLNLITTKAKLLGLDENYTQINLITNKIQDDINTIQNENTSLDKGLSIVVYVENSKVILTEIILKNEVKYTVYGESKYNTSTRYILMENLSTNLEYNKVELKEIETRSNTKSTYSILYNMDDNIKIDAYIENTGLEEENVQTTCKIDINKDNVISTLQYEQKINFVEEMNNIVNLNSNNCGILNNYTTEQLQVLTQSIMQRIETILQEKKQLVGWVENKQIYDEDLNAIENDNMTIEQIQQNSVL